LISGLTKTLLGFAIGIGLCVSVSNRVSHAAKPVPSAPYYYVLDEPHVLSERTLKSIQSLLVEHDRTTGEQIVIAVFESLDGEDSVDFTNRVFSTWQIGKRDKNNGVLLALYWKNRKSRIEVGYGLEPILTDARSKTILNEYLAPELKAGNPDRAIALSALQILTVLESPLVTNGQAQKILESGGLTGGWEPRSKETPVGITLLNILGIAILIWIINRLTAREAHFSGSGWYHPNPLTNPFPHSLGRSTRRLPRNVHSGSWGGGGSFGGFSGGGGRSGGGGASGSW